MVSSFGRWAMVLAAGLVVAALPGCRGCGSEVATAPEPAPSATEPSKPAIGLTATATRRGLVDFVNSFDAGKPVEAGGGATSH